MDLDHKWSVTDGINELLSAQNLCQLWRAFSLSKLSCPRSRKRLKREFLKNYLKCCLMYLQLTSGEKTGRCGLCGLLVVRTVNGNWGDGVGFESEYEMSTMIKSDKVAKKLTFIFIKKISLSFSKAHAWLDDNLMIIRKNFHVYLYISPHLNLQNDPIYTTMWNLQTYIETPRAKLLNWKILKRKSNFLFMIS